ncbi:hypothetical protein CDAR_544741 [Caerostris darwini]|uniref:Uncharacterized protein n=1 Tax=Caerostris darwini TaxID=1538125 RepID=A0AAV4TNP8_9ARAC|nr:hypothetical protein CDAR_544741 [Caerostris darwini]
MCLAICNFCHVGDPFFSAAHLSLLTPRNDVVERKKNTARWVSFSACDSRLSLAKGNFIMNRSNEVLAGKKEGAAPHRIRAEGRKMTAPPRVNDTRVNGANNLRR